MMCISQGKYIFFPNDEDDAPIFTHDCNSCILVGHIRERQGNMPAVGDVYVHSTTVLIRTGNDGPEYWSMPFDDATTVSQGIQSNRGLFHIAAQVALHMLWHCEYSLDKIKEELA